MAGFCRALPSKIFRVALVPAEAEEVVTPERRRFTEAQLLRGAGFLRSRNAHGFHVFVRPETMRHVLVDDLCEDGLAALRAAHHVAAVVETSPHCLQAWVTVSEEEITAPVATAVARHLAARFGGDPGAADATHLGRLPGLANRKLLHQRSDGSFPWARLRAAPGGVDPGGAALMEEALRRVTAPLRAAGAGSLLPRTQARGRIRWRSPAEEHREAERRVRLTLPPLLRLDRSRLDFAVARRLLGRGASVAFVTDVIAAGARADGLGPRVRAEYAHRTVAAAARALSGVEDG
ncbi:DNA-primase RepB domain-containing protein [Sabulicella glaciei]|uniref:RepB family DNA primase n=1 Tax=Sabulicella glaciei TaxID=2984948 RepID=A0ABT3NZW6_9PROT|nr:RepB family DNA primase [Roseococcus sp. MDT2-1-1]